MWASGAARWATAKLSIKTQSFSLYFTGTSGADDVSLTSANTGELNSSFFSGISSIDTAGGFDTVNTNASTTLTGISSQVITNGVTVSNFETLVSTDGNLVGSGSSDTFAITGADTGTVGGVNFSSVENLNGGASNDTFSYTGSGQTSGDINGGADLDTITIDVGALGTFTFSGQIDNVEDIDLNGGTLVLNGSLTNGGTLDLATGTVQAGTGSIEAAQVNLNGGTIAPGTSPGTLSMDADLTASAASTFSFELNGLTPGTEFDQILFTGLTPRQRRDQRTVHPRHHRAELGQFRRATVPRSRTQPRRKRPPARRTRQTPLSGNGPPREQAVALRPSQSPGSRA